MLIFAPAKINLTLDILGKRSDGYHELWSIMQSITLGDLVEIEPAEELKLKIAGANLPADETNIAIKAARALMDATGKTFGAKITLYKKIPQEAGLAGGSTDGAAVLFGLNRLYNLNFSAEELEKIGARVGADVPFCLKGGTALVEGIGEKVTRLTPLKKGYFVLYKLPFGISTRMAYLKLAGKDLTTNRPNHQKVLEALARENLQELGQNLKNVLEISAMEIRPEIYRYKKELLNLNPLGVLMSGSGSTLFALTENLAKAYEIFRKINLPGQKFIVRPYAVGPTCLKP
ncbi:4-(cytidine 5'-diphospho)-2-C-methyl-D-erythritol kinase [Carboxydothermus pertinax]|uniref:4-diphosphocytidyl-2-C-methyl-D-erythritol kinase n=1 Tax=Carboxydothermus pertinax TaxID=870242 RepID=A0A1L8CV71_9THEO|nr:4-(cytidine 5'-diphospho)-2-C-methyl-D-erythritol kinase [Carboxydothermus pertinax]GAV22802.1 4-diphosphocytidyl-2C-methyl-D-erythritol kinase [Carboxydothermus pertinax]